MTNEEKAEEIATRWKAKGLPYNAIYDTALEAMQWKDKQQWKPTEKQLDALLDCANNSTRKNFLELNSLYDDLKKL